MQSLFAFAAALLSFRLTGILLRGWKERGALDRVAWAGGMLAYAVASAALAWGSAAGWSEPAFRVYYLAGGLLVAALLGVGSMLRAGARWAWTVGLVYAGLTIGVAVAMPVHGRFSGTEIPDARDHLDFFPAQLVAIVGNSLGTLAVVGVALWSFKRRPLGNSLILAGIGVAALGSKLADIGAIGSSAFTLVAVVLLYMGFVGRLPRLTLQPRLPLGESRPAATRRSP